MQVWSKYVRKLHRINTYGFSNIRLLGFHISIFNMNKFREIKMSSYEYINKFRLISINSLKLQLMHNSISHFPSYLPSDKQRS